jgi:hypothetical protein
MTLEKYLDALIIMVKNNPKIAKLDVIYSHDDEGNEFQKVGMLPSLMKIENIESDRFLEPTNEGEYNAICIN